MVKDLKRVLIMDRLTGTADDFVKDGVKLFLVYDFDGVFNVMRRNGTFKKTFYNPTHKEHHPNPHYDDFRKKFLNGDRRYTKEPKSYELMWSEELVNDSNKLSARDDVQVLWLTTWRHHMKDVSDRLGFTYARSPLSFVWGVDDLDSDHFAKIDAFEAFFKDFHNDSVGVVWADDVVHKSADFVYKDVEKVSGLTDENLLLLCPDDWYGISRSGWDSVKTFSKKFLF